MCARRGHSGWKTGWGDGGECVGRGGLVRWFEMGVMGRMSWMVCEKVDWTVWWMVVVKRSVKVAG